MDSPKYWLVNKLLAFKQIFNTNLNVEDQTRQQLYTPVKSCMLYWYALLLQTEEPENILLTELPDP